MCNETAAKGKKNDTNEALTKSRVQVETFKVPVESENQRLETKGASERIKANKITWINCDFD
jgi:hypothetical protein